MECVCVIFPICSYFIYHSLDNLLFIQNSTNYIPRGEFGSAWRDDRTYEGLVFAYVCAGVILIGVWVLVSKLFKVHRFKKKFQRYLGHVDKCRSQIRIDVMSMKPRKLSAVLS